ncbi:MAG TPA: hypothetical protein VF520_12000 [Thermoleophilaceae bacterium]|jgi:hypothetical protein
MGVLDDAIREHLELKRKRGAADDELARQELEALGPARRDPVPEPAEPLEAGEVAEEHEAGDEHEGAEYVDSDVPEADVVAVDPPEPAPHGDAVAAVEPVHPPVHEVDRELEPPPPVEPAVTEPPPPAAAEPAAGEPAAGDGDEDPLEETPEFLRETPEHDRLWFEQKPPRDFDLED